MRHPEGFPKLAASRRQAAAFVRKRLWNAMIRSELLKMLVCPETQAPLEIASDALIARVNQAIARGQLKNKAGQPLKSPLEGGLVRSDQRVLYPVLDDIPMMLIDESVPLDQPALMDA
jgi:uncharacterized protein YbaR (Trm112 family)